MSDDGGMKPRNDVTDGRADDRLRCCRQPEPTRAIAHEGLLADHHREEVLAALDAIAAALGI
jgi:hypothetical protein